MGHHAHHTVHQQGQSHRLQWALWLTGGFLVVELGGAAWTGSLALLSDAAHVATDAFSLLISLVAVHLSQRPADLRRTYGYLRLEALGAFINSGLLLAVSADVFWQSMIRLWHPVEVSSIPMMAIAGVGLVVNGLAVLLLRQDNHSNLTMKGAYLEVISDFFAATMVMLGAVTIRLTGWVWIDPILAMLMSLWMLPRAWLVLREAVNVLLEGVPQGVDVAAIERSIQTCPGVRNVHDLHVWALASQTPALTVHIVVQSPKPEQVRQQIGQILHERFGVDHITVQLEPFVSDGQACDCASNRPHAHPQAPQCGWH